MAKTFDVGGRSDQAPSQFKKPVDLLKQFFRVGNMLNHMIHCDGIERCRRKPRIRKITRVKPQIQPVTLISGSGMFDCFLVEVRAHTLPAAFRHFVKKFSRTAAHIEQSSRFLFTQKHEPQSLSLLMDAQDSRRN